MGDPLLNAAEAAWDEASISKFYTDYRTAPYGLIVPVFEDNQNTFPDKQVKFSIFSF
jgi:hypothetical protein